MAIETLLKHCWVLFNKIAHTQKLIKSSHIHVFGVLMDVLLHILDLKNAAQLNFGKSPQTIAHLRTNGLNLCTKFANAPIGVVLIKKKY